jgi:hypothetical protein
MNNRRPHWRVGRADSSSPAIGNNHRAAPPVAHYPGAHFDSPAANRRPGHSRSHRHNPDARNHSHMSCRMDCRTRSHRRSRDSPTAAASTTAVGKVLDAINLAINGKQQCERCQQARRRTAYAPSSSSAPKFKLKKVFSSAQTRSDCYGSMRTEV